VPRILVSVVKYPTQQQVQRKWRRLYICEQPLDLTSASFWSQGSKSPGLLTEKHPLGLYAPCCFKNMKKYDGCQDKRKDVGQCQKTTYLKPRGDGGTGRRRCTLRQAHILYLKVGRVPTGICIGRSIR
jgi:hypothetical protein